MEEFIFDDDVDEVGAEVEAHCPKCKADTQHVVVSKYEDEIRRVQCNPCGDVHPYRKPRGESDEEEPAPAVKKKVQKAKHTWDQVMAKSAKKQPKMYQLGDYFKEMELISHPKFGVGFVSENIGDDKIEVTFKDDLIQRRRCLPTAGSRPVPGARLHASRSGISLFSKYAIMSFSFNLRFFSRLSCSWSHAASPASLVMAASRSRCSSRSSARRRTSTAGSLSDCMAAV